MNEWNKRKKQIVQFLCIIFPDCFLNIFKPNYQNIFVLPKKKSKGKLKYFWGGKQSF